MDSDGRDSSLGEFSSPESSPSRRPTLASANQPVTVDISDVFEDEDSNTDVSMSADSDEEDEEPIPEPEPSPTDSMPPEAQSRTEPYAELDVMLLHEQDADVGSEAEADSSRKRKLDKIDLVKGTEAGQHEEVRKRQKPNEVLPTQTEARSPKDMSALPAEIWHHIFTFCSPKTLGSLLPVNRSFNSYVDASASSQSLSADPTSTLSLLSPDAIWKASRLAIHGLPTPLFGRSELDMWKLACGSTCQFCHKKRQANTSPKDQWHPGPGENGVIPIWSFAIRSCGTCLQKHTTKEIDLLLSSTIPSPLMTALPFVFITNEQHVISAAALQVGQQPPHIQITKHFSNEQIDEVRKEFQDVKALGTATAEEWLKGLDGRGRERRNDAARWERWEASGGVGRIQAAEVVLASEAKVETNNGSQSNGLAADSVATSTNGSLNGHPISNSQQLQHPVAVFEAKQNQLGGTAQIPSGNLQPRTDSPAQNGFSAFQQPNHGQLQHGQPQHGQPKHVRTKQEVAELKEARRADIERRCLQLDPPITAGVLSHMPSFQAAIQIIQPVTDSAWEVLKPRLLSQREEAEHREKDRLAQTRVVQARFDQLRHQDEQVKSEPMDDSQWDEFQAPLRARIGGYADEIIRDGWNGGAKVNHENAPQFAAEVLIYVRKRFYAEVAKDEAALRATGREPGMDPPEGPYSRKLILDNMKWVFDTKIKPHTEPYRKEMFVCNACGFVNKHYGFEGVIQHYAAKHIESLSIGNAVVNWKSEWPDLPPFNPDPSSMQSTDLYSAVPGAAPSTSSFSAPDVVSQVFYGGYQPTSGPIQGPPSQGYQTPAPFSGHQKGPFGPPQISQYPNYSQGYQLSQYSAAPAPPGVSAYNGPSQSYPQQGYGGQYPAPVHAPGMYSIPQSATPYPAPAPIAGPYQGTYGPPGPQNGSYNQAQPYPANNYVPPKSEEYTSQLQNVARNAREIWNSIGNLKEVPGSLKVYTVIHHVLVNFHAVFNDTPPLSMIVDGLSNNKDMRPVRNVNGLLCKACSLGMLGSNANTQKKHFSFPQLVNHFHAIHEQGVPPNSVGHIPDWTQDMVELPDMLKLAGVENAPNMDDKKLGLITAALPKLVQPAKPSRNEYNGNSQQRYAEYPPNEYQQLAPSEDNHSRYYGATEDGGPAYESGEYDPSHPEILPGSKAPQRKFSKEYPRDEPAGNSHSRYLDGDQKFYAEPTQPYIKQHPTSSHAPQVARYEQARDEPQHVDRPVRYRESDSIVQTPTHYDDRGLPPRAYKETNVQAHNSNHEQSRIYDVVAQISQHAQKAQARQPIKNEPIDGGSEDGGVRPGTGVKPLLRSLPLDERSAAEHFLEHFRPGEPYEPAPPRPEVEYRREPPSERPRYVYEEPEPSRQPRDSYQETAGRRPADEYEYQERGAPITVQAYPEDTIHHQHTPESVDRRYKPSVVYQEEPQDSPNTYRTPSRYTRYESARLENDRGRSRSPVYTKSNGPLPTQYQDAPLHLLYRDRRPPPPHDYYPQRVYLDEPPTRPRYEEAAAPAYELVRVSDPSGDYMIRRPVQRREPVYYEDEYAPPPQRQPVYDSRGPPQRPEGGQYFEEEYDPMAPAAPVRQNQGPGPAPLRY